jgi:predicted enzyme related to lactoylglutathione lyase
MPTRERAPLGSPCWVDLWTSDVEGSRAFYGELFGWVAEEANPEFGGYFMFTRDGVPVAGAMGAMGEDMPADDAWKIYLHSDDIARTLSSAEAAGGQVGGPAMEVADLGVQAVLSDPTGAALGTWQPGTFPGFTVLEEPGTPSWFELFTRDHAGAVAFYESVFHWKTNAVGDTDEFRYSTMQDPDGDDVLAGIMDASAWLPEGVPAHWSVYWAVDEPESTITTLKALGGSVIAPFEDTPYGRLATVADPAGAEFKLRQPPSA